MKAIGEMSNSFELLDPRGKDAQPKPSSMPAGGRLGVGLDVTAVCSPRVGNANKMATTKTKARAKGREQNAAAAVLTPEVAAATEC